MLAVGPLGPQQSLIFAWYELGRQAHMEKDISKICDNFLIFFFQHKIIRLIGRKYILLSFYKGATTSSDYRQVVLIVVQFHCFFMYMEVESGKAVFRYLSRPFRKWRGGNLKIEISNKKVWQCYLLIYKRSNINMSMSEQGGIISAKLFEKCNFCYESFRNKHNF